MKKIVHKILLLLSTNIILGLSILVISGYFLVSQGANNMDSMKQGLMNRFDSSLDYVVSSSMRIIEYHYSLYESGVYESVEEAMAEAAEGVRPIRYGNNGYVFIDTMDGYNVVMMGIPAVEGAYRGDFVDSIGQNLHDVMEEGSLENGGGVFEYYYPKPGE